ncbi:MAG TPA: hypothetical protein VFN78_08710 [Ktedonobacterales bacterium]|nr:hypothetical protein [Ktedonobacterales bacterium]
MDERHPPASETSETQTGTPSVTGYITDDAESLPALNAADPSLDAQAGDLRPIWPTRAPGEGARRSRRYALFARLTATACALLFFYVSWAPLATAITSGDLRSGPTGPLHRFGLTAAELGAPPLHALVGDVFFGLWSALTITGILLSPLLWQTSIRWLRWVATALAACWLVVMTVIFAQTAYFILVGLPEQLRRGAGPYQATLVPYGIQVAIYNITSAFGLWLALLAVLLGIAAAALAVMASVTYQRARAPIAPTVQGEIVTPGAARPARSLPGVGAMTGGLLLWAWGFFALPWATINCTQAPVLIGTCRGLQGTPVLWIGLDIVRMAFDPSAALYAITGLLLVGALMILLSVWRRDITRTLCAWASAWLAFTLACSVVAISGVQQVVSDAPSVNMPTGDWRGDTGVLVVFLALLLVGIGLIPLWAVAVRNAQRREAELRAQGA